MKESIVERLLYIILLVAFLAIGVGTYAVAVNGHKTTLALQQQKQILEKLEAVNAELQTDVTKIQATSNQNAASLECLINLHAQGIVPSSDSCHVAEASPPAQSTQPTQPSQPSPAAAPSNPTPTPQPSVIQSVLKMLGL